MTDYSKLEQETKEFGNIKPKREIKINFAPFIGVFLALYAAYTLWGGLGVMFTTGLLLQSWTIAVTFRRRQ